MGSPELGAGHESTEFVREVSEPSGDAIGERSVWLSQHLSRSGPLSGTLPYRLSSGFVCA